MQKTNRLSGEKKSKLQEFARPVASVPEPASSQPPPRVVIERVEPQIDGGQYPAKRIVGDQVVVTADVFADGHDSLTAVLRYRHIADPDWKEVAMQEMGNDAWR